VDLVFRHKEKYYIADWKSNRLVEGYGRTDLDACMEGAGYHLQYKLYTVAVLRWLQGVFGNRFDVDRYFGGVFYFFLRGMGSGNGQGVYYVAPGAIGPLARLESEVAAQISKHGQPSL
jgi:exodeoxyribonuclease V beta subunit